MTPVGKEQRESQRVPIPQGFPLLPIKGCSRPRELDPSRKQDDDKTRQHVKPKGLQGRTNTVMEKNRSFSPCGDFQV